MAPKQKRAPPDAQEAPPEKAPRRDQVVPATPADQTPCRGALASSSQGNLHDAPNVWRNERLPERLPPVEESMSVDQLYRTMNAIGSHVIKTLPGFMKTHAGEGKLFAATATVNNEAPLSEHAPLELPDTSSSDGMSSYKAPWQASQSETTLRATGLYEAAANIVWLNPFPADDVAQVISGDPPEWQQVVQVADAFMCLDADQAGALAPPQGKSRIKRLIFPVVLPVHVRNVEAAGRAMGLATLPVVSGQIYVLAWFLGMYRALSLGDIPWVAALWQMGLTTSVQARHSLGAEGLALWSIQSSEGARILEGVIGDTFQAFALKCLRCLKDPQVSDAKASKILTDLGVTFRGAKPNKSMAAAVLLFRTGVDAKCLSLLRDIEQAGGKDGKDIFSTGYSKLARVVQVCQEAAKAMDEPPAKLLAYVLGAIAFDLRMEEVTASELTVAKLDKARDGTPGLVPLILGRFAVVRYLALLVEDMRSNLQCRSIVKDMDTLFADVQDYGRYEAAFSASDESCPSAVPASSRDKKQTDKGQKSGEKPTDKGQKSGEKAEKAEDTVGDEDHPTAEYKKNFMTTKCGRAAVDFLYDLLSGEHDEVIGRTAKEGWKDANWAALEVNELKDLVRQLSVQRAIVIGDGAPPANARALQRYDSEAQDDADKEMRQKEREDAWKNAGGMRRKFVQFLSPRKWTEQELQTAYESTREFKRAFVAGQSHRIFLLNADLLHEDKHAPWALLPEWKADLMKPAVRFCLKQTGPGDVLVFFVTAARGRVVLSSRRRRRTCAIPARSSLSSARRRGWGGASRGRATTKRCF